MGERFIGMKDQINHPGRAMNLLQRGSFGPALIAILYPYLNWIQMSGIHSGPDAYRATIIVVTGMLVVTAFLSMLLRSRDLAGLLSLILVALLMRSTAPVFSIVALTIPLILIIIERGIPYEKIRVFSNICGFLVLSSFLFLEMKAAIRGKTLLTTSSESVEGVRLNQTPSVIHIVLDGYGSAATLSDLYDHDNSEFVSFLESRDFQVFPNISTPFNQTLFTMSSIMSGGYIGLPEEGVDTALLRTDLGHTISDGPVLSALKDADYNISYTASGYAYLNINGGVRIKNDLWLTGFEAHLLNFIPSLEAGYANEIVRSALDPGTYSALQEPFFHYQHLLAPHPPFTVDRHGNPRPGAAAILDGTHFTAGLPELRAEYIDGYREKAMYVESALQNQLNSLPDDGPLIILVHGDHGPGAYFDHESLQNSNANERMTTFFAVYSNMPDILQAFAQQTEAEFSLVNIYRTIFSVISNETYELLPNVKTFLEWSRPSRSEIVPG